MKFSGLKNLIILILFLGQLSLILTDDSEESKLKEWRESRAIETKEGWYFPFEVDDDSNKFPDDWSRSKNYKLADGKTLAFASWAEIKLDNKTKKAGKNSLHILSEGAQPISIETDNFKVDNFTAYELSGWFNLDQETCKRTQLNLGVLWYDEEHNLLPQRTEDKFNIGFTGGWEFKKQRINQIDSKAKFCRLYIKAEGEDKNAKIWIDEVRFSKRPLIQIDTNKFLNMFGESDLFSFNVKVRGLEKVNYFLDISMYDIHNERIFFETKTISLTPNEIAEKKEISLVIQPMEKGSFIDKDKPERNHLIKGVFYFNVILKNEVEEIGGNSLRVGRVKIDKRNRIKDDGEVFGVTVNDISASYRLREGLDLVSIQRVKLPVWHDNLVWEGTQFKLDETRKHFLETVKEIKTGDNQPEIVGVFAPRPKVLENLSEKGIINLVKSDEKTWRPFFESNIYNLRTSIKTWQLGDDQDASFSNDEYQQSSLEILNQYLEKAGQVGSATKILSNPSILNKQLVPHHWLMFHDFEYTDDFNFDEFGKVLPKDSEQFTVKKWLTVPLKSRRLFNNDRDVAIDLFKKIVWARNNGIKRIYISKYQDEFSGLINHKNELTPAFITAKLCAEQLSEVSYMGSLPEFGDEIQNFVFSLNQNPKKAILVAWTKRSDDKNRSYEFNDTTLISAKKNLNDLIADLNLPDVNLNFKIDEFFPNLNGEVSKSHIIKGLNTIINTPNLRQSYLLKYADMARLSKSPYLRTLIKNNIKTENEEKECVRLILEENYPKTMYNIEQIQKSLLLDQEVDQIDLMGNSKPLGIKWFDGDPYQDVVINQYPVIFTGLSRDFINTRISIQLDTSVILYSRLEKQKQTLIIQNYFDQPMEGIFIINYPATWTNFNPFIKFRLEKGEKKSYDFYIIPSRIANPGPIEIGLKTTFNTDRKYSFHSVREGNLVSDLIVGRPGEKVAIVPPKFGDTRNRHILNVPISLRPDVPNRPNEIDLVVSLDLPDGETMSTRVDKVQAGTFRVANFSIKLKKEFNNKLAKIKIEQRGSSSNSLIFHNMDIPIPDAE